MFKKRASYQTQADDVANSDIGTEAFKTQVDQMFINPTEGFQSIMNLKTDTKQGTDFVEYLRSQRDNVVKPPVKTSKISDTESFISRRSGK